MVHTGQVQGFFCCFALLFIALICFACFCFALLADIYLTVTVIFQPFSLTLPMPRLEGHTPVEYSAVIKELSRYKEE